MLFILIKLISDSGYQTEIGTMSSACNQIDVFSKFMKTFILNFYTQPSNEIKEDFIVSSNLQLKEIISKSCKSILKKKSNITINQIILKSGIYNTRRRSLINGHIFVFKSFVNFFLDATIHLERSRKISINHHLSSKWNCVECFCEVEIIILYQSFL